MLKCQIIRQAVELKQEIMQIVDKLPNDRLRFDEFWQSFGGSVF
jgi:hypothetical protein